MATRIASEALIPSGFAETPREPQTLRIAHAEEGDSRGEGWFLMRAIVLLVGVILGVGWLLG